MDREEILEMSRQENRNQDEMERDALARGGQKALSVGGIVCMLLIILEAVFAKEVNPGTWAVYLSMTGTLLVYKYTRLKKKHELVTGVIQLMLAAVFFVMCITRRVG